MRPDEVVSRDFDRALRGYDRAEVRGFLEQVALELGRRDRRIADLEAALSTRRTTGADEEPARSTAADAPSSPAPPFPAILSPRVQGDEEELSARVLAVEVSGAPVDVAGGRSPRRADTTGAR